MANGSQAVMQMKKFLENDMWLRALLAGGKRPVALDGP